MGKYINIFPLLFLIIAVGCNNSPYETSSIEENPLLVNSDNQYFIQNDTVKYTITCEFEDSVMYLYMADGSIAYQEDFPITSEAKSDVVATIGISTLQPEPEGINANQTMIMYNYYNTEDQMLPVGSKTGVVDNPSNVWLHPPRNGPFKILNLHAYPFVKFPLEIGKKWDYEMLVNKKCGHSGFGSSWIEDDILFKFSYEVTEQLNDGSYTIIAKSKSDLGETLSQFVFDKKRGFTKMTFSCFIPTLSS